MRRILTIAALLLTLIVSSLNPAYADETAAKVYDTAAQLLTGTGNVTLTGNATFSLDGEAFKFVETTYIQDGVNSKWVLNLSSPRADGSLRENGFTAIAKCVPRSPAASRVHANSISAVSSPQPKEDASSFPSVFSGFKI